MKKLSELDRYDLIWVDFLAKPYEIHYVNALQDGETKQFCGVRGFYSVNKVIDQVSGEEIFHRGEKILVDE